jgi:GNAT superfamily N-acetyltransferase
MSTLTSVDIRPATLRDAKIVSEIHAQTAQAAFRGLVPDDVLKSMTADKRVAQWREAIEYCEPQVQVAMEDGKVVGFVGFDRSRDPKSRPTTGEIWAIYVLPSHWDKGIGVALWDAAREGLSEEGCTNVTVWAPLQNERALRFFEMAAFKREMNTAKTVPVGSIRIEEIRLKRDL